MDFHCPRCGMALEAKNNALHIQCPNCNAIFRADEIASPAPRQQDHVIDVHAEVISSEFDGPCVETSTEPLEGAYRHSTTDRQTDTRVYLTKNMTFESREGCSCGGCGCLTLLFLLLFLMFGL